MATYEKNVSTQVRDSIVLIVDDHSLICDVLLAALCLEKGFHAESVSSVDAAFNRIGEAGRFDIILLDYEVPGMDGLNGMRRLISANEGSVALFSGVANWTVVEQAIRAGACGYIPKTLPLRTLKHALRIIAEGELYLPGEFMYRTPNAEAADIGLKPREMRVLGFLCEGMPNKEIGKNIGVEETIVKMDVKSICRKLSVRNRTQAVISAMKRGVF
ncbi:response regulator [Roseinatronobacter monicus]|uniref:LuxR family two component transcriptional regulator n=1 Tax=Roseinatronobacter monicus TaxID=393481 RepID=A0A543K4D1_9RHOB|nr:response regulator transcription factor [Roseinatronobacter monicus]TQM89884.1 LuxR family two component transcriptional regulator [Roseinatronobacter monicus]